jgi:hypothetical protein
VTWRLSRVIRVRTVALCVCARRLPGMLAPVGAENTVTLCDLGIFMDQAAEPVPAQNAHTGHFDGRIHTSDGRLLPQ